jgi:hypothetical protein
MVDTLLDEAPAAPKKPQPVTLRASHDYTLVATALDVRKEDLKKLATKVDADGYKREARAIRADADAIEHQILPSFAEQRELPLVTHDQLEKEIGAALRRFVYMAFDGLANPKVVITPSGLASRRDELLKSLTARVTVFATDLADEAFNQGVAAREQSAEALALRAVATLRATGD